MGQPFKTIYEWLQIENAPIDYITQKNFCYALMSWTTGDWYIGSTKNGAERWKQHIQEAKHIWERKGKQKYRTMNIHKCMNRTGPQNWIMIPLSDNTPDRKKFEWKLIRTLKPTLNTIWKKEGKGNRHRPLKKYRDKTKKPEKKNLDKKHYTTFYVGSIPFNDLFQAIKTHIGSGSLSISWTRGAIDSTNYVRLWKWFKHINGTFEIQTTIDTQSLPFTSTKEIRNITRKHTMGTIHITEYKVNEIITEFSKRAIQIARGKTSTDDINPSTIWKFFAARRYIKEKSIRQAVGKTLQKIFKKFFGFQLKKRLTIKIPFDHNIKKNKVLCQAHNIVNSMDLPDTAKKLLKDRVKVIFSKRRSIGDITLNHIPFSKSITDITVQCLCKSIVKKNDRHYVRKISEAKMDNITPLQQNKNNIPTPSKKDAWSSINKALWIFKKQMELINKRDMAFNTYKATNKCVQNTKTYILNNTTENDILNTKHQLQG